MAEQWSAAKDAAYNDAIARGDMAAAGALVAERDALVKANEDWHRARGTGPFAGSGGGGGSSDNGAAAAAEAAKAEARQAASAWLTTILKQYGMDGMSGSVDALVREWGTNTQVITVKLKETQQYKDRFKGLLALQAKGITDISNEAEYIKQETAYRQVFREAGIQSYIGDAGSAAERDAIATLVGDYSVSVDEVRSRVQDAQRVVADTAPEVTDALQRYYNVSPQDLVAFTLDPSRAKNRINDIANAAIIGGYAAQRGLNADVGTAEAIASLSGTADVQMQALLPQLSNASIVADSTQRLASIEDTDLTDSQVLMSEFSLDSDADKKIKGLQSRERARFSGKSGITSSTLSRSSGV
jgi:hypothetical protein